MKKRNFTTETFTLLQSLSIGDEVTAEVTSRSMEPTLSQGEKVVVKRADFSTLRSGDIIAFYIAGLRTMIIHRVVNMHRNDDLYVITRGDANADTDPWVVYEENFLGVIQPVRL